MKRHPFFRSDNWTWENIRKQEPPVVPELEGDMDTQYFDVIDDEKDKPVSFAPPRVSPPLLRAFLGEREREREGGEACDDHCTWCSEVMYIL